MQHLVSEPDIRWRLRGRHADGDEGDCRRRSCRRCDGFHKGSAVCPLAGAEDSGILTKQEDGGKEEIDQLGSDVLKQMEKNECKSKEEKPAVVSTAFKIVGSMAFVAAVSFITGFITIWKTSSEWVKFLTNFFALQKTAKPLCTIMYSKLQMFNPIKKLISKWEKIELGEKTDEVWRMIQLKTIEKRLVKDEEHKDAEECEP